MKIKLSSGTEINVGYSMLIIADDGTEFQIKDVSISRGAIGITREDSRYIEVICDHTISIKTKPNERN